MTVWAIRSIAGLVLAALFVVFVVERADRDEHAAANVVMSYVKAWRADDASKACEQLTAAQRRDVVARVSRTPPSRSSPRDCERYVLVRSRWSELARPALATFRVAGAVAVRFANDVRLVRPSGFDAPVVEVWNHDGEWKIDTQAAERSSFVMFCEREGQQENCACLFDQARAMDPRVLDGRDQVMDLFADFESGRRKGLFRKLTQRCAGGRNVA